MNYIALFSAVVFVVIVLMITLALVRVAKDAQKYDKEVEQFVFERIGEYRTFLKRNPEYTVVNVRTSRCGTLHVTAFRDM